MQNYTHTAEHHIVVPLGRCKLRDLTAADVDRWLRAESRVLSTRSLRLAHSLLNCAVRHAMARYKVKGNVVGLCAVPTGQSKSLTLSQADAVLRAAEASQLHAYIVLLLPIGARTEELRALCWSDVDLTGQPDATPRYPRQSRSCDRSGSAGTPRPAGPAAASPCPNCASPRFNASATSTRGQPMGWSSSRPQAPRWTHTTCAGRSAASSRLPVSTPRRGLPREMRHSFVSLLSDSGVPIEHISRLVGHSGIAVTETVLRQQLRPVLEEGATAMFPTDEEAG